MASEPSRGLSQHSVSTQDRAPGSSSSFPVRPNLHLEQCCPPPQRPRGPERIDHPDPAGRPCTATGPPHLRWAVCVNTKKLSQDLVKVSSSPLSLREILSVGHRDGQTEQHFSCSAKGRLSADTPVPCANTHCFCAGLPDTMNQPVRSPRLGTEAGAAPQTHTPRQTLSREPSGRPRAQAGSPA